jgi:signal peptidase I
VSRLLAIRRAPVFELVFTVVFAVGLALAVQAYAVKPYRIPSGSMKPTLEIGERVLVNRFSTRLGGDPERGDVIVFHPPASAVEGVHECAVPPADGRLCEVQGTRPADETFIKRVVAVPGDRLSIDDGIPVVNGERYRGDWRIIPCGGADGCDYPQEITLSDDEYFVMGDNRPGSDDSRFWGPVPREWIIGQAVFSYWPPDRVGSL